MSSMKVSSVSKADENNDIIYNFDISYGSETFQIHKTSEELKSMIATSVEIFPTLAPDSLQLYQEASNSNSFVLENLKTYFNLVFQSMINVFAYPSFLMHIDPASVPSTFMRVSIVMQDAKIRSLNEKLDKLDSRMEKTEKIIRECLALTEKLAFSSSPQVPVASPAAETVQTSRVSSPGEIESLKTPPSLPPVVEEDEPIVHTEELRSVRRESDSKTTEPEIPDVPLPELNQETLETALNYFKSNLPQFSYFDREVNQFYELLQPSTKDMNVRSSIVDYLKSQIRLSLSCSLFVSDLEMIDCTTFTENKIVINLLIGKSYQASWDSILLEHLNYISESGAYLKNFGLDKAGDLNPGSETSSADPADVTSHSPNEFNQSLMSGLGGGSPGGDSAFKIQDIILHNNSAQNQETNTTLSSYLTCKVNDTFVEIRGNPLGDLCLLSLMEEISLAIGKDKLFKKSLTIITEFLHNELSEIYSKSQNKQENGKTKLQRDLFPDSILWIMVISIFNKFYNIIESPFQALLLFLMEYSFYNPEHSVITIYGLMELPPLTASQPPTYTLFINKPNALLKPTILEKYWNFVNVEEAMVNNEIFNSTLVGNPVVQKKFQPNVAVFPAFATNNGLTTVHPFYNSVIQSGQIALNTPAQQIREVFQSGLLRVMHFIEDLSSVSNQPGSLDQIKFDLFFTSIFPEIKKKALNRGEHQTKLRSPLDQESPTHKKEKLMDYIFYCNFILKSIITEQALLYACIETIDMKGTLPVGEIGKVITVHSNIAQLSLHLKEKFGGLKKFLERFPTFFVFGNDHQYNPHVYLRNKLSPEHQQMIYRGVLPMQIILQYKKAKLSKKISKKFSALAPVLDGSTDPASVHYHSDENSSDGSHPKDSFVHGMSDPFTQKLETNPSAFPYFDNAASSVPPPQLKPPALQNSSFSRQQVPPAPALSLSSFGASGSQFGQNALPGRNPSAASFGAPYGRSNNGPSSNSFSSQSLPQSSGAGYPNISFASNQPSSTSSWSTYSAPAATNPQQLFNAASDNYSQFPSATSTSSNYGLFNSSSPKVNGVSYRPDESLSTNSSYFQANDAMNSSYYDVQPPVSGFNPNSRGFFPSNPNSNKRF